MIKKNELLIYNHRNFHHVMILIQSGHGKQISKLDCKI